jgi:hypothetical protein
MEGVKLVAQPSFESRNSRIVFQKQLDLCGADPLIRAGRPRPALLQSTNFEEADEGVGCGTEVPPRKIILALRLQPVGRLTA